MTYIIVLNSVVEKMEHVILQEAEYVTYEGERRFYLSSHHLKPVYTSQFKSLSLRTLSVEYVGPGREGPVLFGDEKNGYNFAYVFKIKDSKARGFARWFAFVLMDPSLSCLTLSWAFLQKYAFILTILILIEHCRKLLKQLRLDHRKYL
jgi:hypothetical protein